MSADDDKTPMIEHEVTATTSFSSNGTRHAVKYRRSTTLLLAIVTFVVFACAFIFIVAALIVPVIRSLDAEQDDVVGNKTSDTAAEADHAGHGRSTLKHQDRPRRSVQQLVDTLRQLAAVCVEFHSPACLADDVV